METTTNIIAGPKKITHNLLQNNVGWDSEQGHETNRQTPKVLLNKVNLAPSDKIFDFHSVNFLWNLFTIGCHTALLLKFAP